MCGSCVPHSSRYGIQLQNKSTSKSHHIDGLMGCQLETGHTGAEERVCQASEVSSPDHTLALGPGSPGSRRVDEVEYMDANGPVPEAVALRVWLMGEGFLPGILSSVFFSSGCFSLA